MHLIPFYPSLPPKVDIVNVSLSIVPKNIGIKHFTQKGNTRDFPGGAVVKTLSSRCRGPGFNPWSGN